MDLVGFPRLYRRFPVSSAFPPDSYVHRLKLIGEEGGEAEIESGIVVGSGGWGEARGGNGVVGSSGEDPDLEPTFMQPPADAKWNKACDPFNLYAPKFVKGLGDEKMGLCPICVEGVERGGEGGERWLKVCFVSFWFFSWIGWGEVGFGVWVSVFFLRKGGGRGGKRGRDSGRERERQGERERERYKVKRDKADCFPFRFVKQQQLKNSSYVYHLSYQHGLSNLTGSSLFFLSRFRPLN